MKHEWEATDTQGYSMECSRGCGAFWSIWMDNADEILDSQCEKPDQIADWESEGGAVPR